MWIERARYDHVLYNIEFIYWFLCMENNNHKENLFSFCKV